MSYIWESGVNNEGNGTDNNQYYISDTSSLVKRLTIQRGSGYVGINTNTPISITDVIVKLDVNGSINFSGNIYKNGQPYVSNSTSWIENETKTKIYYMSGNVGINNIEPLELLDVNGNIKSTNIIANGSGLTNLNASEIITGKINSDRLPETISVSNFIGSGEYLTNLNSSNIDSGKINNNILPSVINVLSFEGDGQGLINLDASKISSGYINNSRLPANISVSTLSGSGLGITNLRAANISGNIPNNILPSNISVTSLSGIGTNITELNASEIKTGKIISSVFLPDNINAQYLSGDGSALSNLDASKITQGKLNNNLFNNDITISGKLTVSNLEVSGSSAIISSSIYETENLEIINYNSLNPSLTINHNSTFNDLLQIYSNNNKIFTILNNGNVGIGGTVFPNSNYKLDVSGNINSSGNISSDIVLIKDNITFYKSSTQNILIKLPQTLTSYTITLPNTGPSANNILKSDSSGNLSWANINESPTLENVYSFFNNTEFEKTSNIKLKNINSSKLIFAFDSTQFELFGSPQIIRIKDDVLTSDGNVSISSLNNPPSVTENTLDIINTNLTIEPEYNNETIEGMYPPTRNLNSNLHTISGQSYGNGDYEIWQSSIYNNDTSSFAGFNAFNDNGYVYHSAGGYSSGIYNSDKYIVSGYNGEWVKIKLPYAIKLTKYGFKIRGGFPGRCPGQYKIYGSNDDNNWVVLVHKTTTISYTSDTFTENITNNNFYNYYAVVVNTLVGRGGTDDSLNIDEWYIYGKENVLSIIEKKIPTNYYKYYILRYESLTGTLTSDQNQRIYNINFSEDVIADILVVGGGGSGGAINGGGGGAGGVVYQTGIIMNGNYDIYVGKGGNQVTSNWDNGKSSYINKNGSRFVYNGITFEGLGGGGGATIHINASNTGGSGGGASTNGGGVPTMYGAASQGNTISINGINMPGGYSGANAGIWFPGGGGGAGGTPTNTDGGPGILLDISGENKWYAAGGGGGLITDLRSAGIGGSGIGGNGTRNANYNGSLVFSEKMNGVNGTGSGGGGGAYNYNYLGGPNGVIGGAGGSGIVIIRYYNVSTKITNKYLKLIYTPRTLVHDFTNYNTETTWKGKAATIPNFTYEFDNWFTDSMDAMRKTGSSVGWIEYILPSGYDKVSIHYGNSEASASNVKLLINGIQKEIIGIRTFSTYTQSYNKGDILRIEEDTGYISANLIITLINTTALSRYTINFPENTNCDILTINNSQYYKNKGVVLYGSYSVIVGSITKLQKNSSDLYLPNTNLNISDSITGSSLTYTSNNPIVIIRYSMSSAISNVVTTLNNIPNGYLKYNNNMWVVENSSILTSKVIYNQICLSRYLSNNNYSMINIYEYSVINDVGVSSDWITISNKDIIYIAKSGYAGAYPTYQNNFVGNILKIRLKSCSLENVYKSFLIDHNSYIHKINCTIKNIYTGGILYNSQDININNATFFSSPELFTNGINLSTNSIPTNVKLLLELKLFVSFDASTNSTTTIKQQTDKFYLFYEEF